jgi:hypothetical protein
MTTLSSDRLAEVTLAALERIAFICGEPAPVDTDALGQAPHAAAIRYRGSCSGTVSVRADDEFLRLLASGLLGMEPDESVDAQTCVDTIKELTNIVTGLVVVELGGLERTIAIGLPETLASAQTAPILAADAPGQTCCLDCEGHKLFVTWTPDASTPAVN